MENRCRLSENHEEDNCDGCQKERAENNSLVGFYQRLGNIENKLDHMKQSIASHQQLTSVHRNKLNRMTNMLTSKPEQTILYIKQHNSNEIGYELASALIQRERKTRIQNQRLQMVIDQLLRDKKRFDQNQKVKEQIKLLNSRQPKLQIKEQRYSDSIDKINQKNDISMNIKQMHNMSNSYFLQSQKSKKYWEKNSIDQDSTSFSAFTTPNAEEKAKIRIQQQYPGLNLWLYQFKPEQLDASPIKSLKMPLKKQNEQRSRYKSKY